MKCFFSLFFLLFCGISLQSAPVLAATDGSLVKNSIQSSVYYLFHGKRYAFPNEKVFFSWYDDFSRVQTISESELASYPLSGNVTYRPGSRLVKIQTDPRVYAVSRGGVLRWVTTERIAADLYGVQWNVFIHDIPDTFFTNYEIGDPIVSTDAYRRDNELNTDTIAEDFGESEPVPSMTIEDAPVMNGCQIFPSDSPWNQRIDQLPVHQMSSTYINSIGAEKGLHPDFGENQSYGIPINVVSGNQPMASITFTDYGDESDPGPYPIPRNALIEAGSDAHVIVLQAGTCRLYELYSAKPSGDGWIAASGAIWDLTSNALRPYGWTSADAAGLPILPGLIRYDEVANGKINHAIRFTASRTQSGFILPATHFAGRNDSSLPPMGLRVRLKADYDISHLTGQARVIAEAMKTYGMILADNGSSWFFQGATDSRWNDDELNQLKMIPGSAFEAVQTGPILTE